MSSCIGNTLARNLMLEGAGVCLKCGWYSCKIVWRSGVSVNLGRNSWHAVSSLHDRLHSSTQAGACGRPGADGFPHPCSRKAQWRTKVQRASGILSHTHGQSRLSGAMRSTAVAVVIKFADSFSHTGHPTHALLAQQDFNHRSERPSSLAMIKSSISSYQDQLATFVGIVCQDKKARPQKHSKSYEPKTTFFLTSIRNGTNSQIFITASTWATQSFLEWENPRGPPFGTTTSQRARWCQWAYSLRWWLG